MRGRREMGLGAKRLLRLLAILSMGAPPGCTDRVLLARLSADALAAPDAADAPDAPLAAGLRGAYFTNMDLQGTPALQRIDPALDVVWQTSPGPGVGNVFSVRWTGDFVPPAPAVYRLRLTSDDGSRLWIDGMLVIDQWKGAPNDRTVEVDLTARPRYPIRVELFSFGGSGSLRLTAQAPGGTPSIVSGAWLSPGP